MIISLSAYLELRDMRIKCCFHTAVSRSWLFGLCRPADYRCRSGLDVGGNRFRIIAAIHYNRQSLFVRHVLTHAQYDLWTRKNLNS
ncbi:type II toxin-antitoxin system HigB family toxin [Paraburkholderia elongata]|uniref:type II toxin-antitoxin system HigB family toxin n=1 Tax=Paraburkholderia elongata TaxID=2675747 RepID=UPI002E288486|nr:type II toxin-antitoxin system HigB family toxin [Paraburkholderia elongata]